CSACEKIHEKDRLWSLCAACGMPLLARYDLAAARLAIDRRQMGLRPPDMWRYRELMPDPGDYHGLGEGFTPLLPVRRLAKRYGLKHLYIKDESVNPTGSFKARGLAPAVAMARKLGAKRLCLPSAGNAGSAAAAYAAWVGLPVHVFLPAETPAPFFRELNAYGAVVHTVDGHIGDAGRAMREMMAAEPEAGWFDLSTLKEPYRLEGKKTMGYELCEQTGGELPDVVIYPTGGGTGLIGMWKAFSEMETLGWIDARRPRMVSVQSTGCAPIVKAFEEGREKAEPWPEPATIASGLRVPSAIGDFLILRGIRESGGRAVAAPEEKLASAVAEIGRLEGIFTAPEGAATLLALQRLLEERHISTSDRVVLFNTGTGLKYLDALSHG
ncbi:MAG TPA: threonine synthase, partial [Candidatus Polarisedimenticolia bacterium]|nr:threonine synthase [Candidatus Polarisedimenticolia bacterium]